MNSIGIIIFTSILIVVLALSNRWALIGLMLGILYLPQSQQFVIYGFHVFAIRIIILASFLRVIYNNDIFIYNLNKLDILFTALYLYTLFIFLIRSNVDHAYMIGTTLDAFLCYFSFKGLIKSTNSIYCLLRDTTILLIPFACFVLVESVSGWTPFSVLGNEQIGWEREGRPRCIGSFRNPTLLGTLGASFLPIYISLLFSNYNRKLTYTGIGLCVFIVWASNSGGSLSCLALGLTGWLFWKYRKYVSFIKYIIVFLFAFLMIFMKAPIWYVLSKVSSISGGDGYHRSRLLELSYENLDKWWLAGMATTETADWFPYHNPGQEGSDICNAFVCFALDGGAVSLFLFIIFLREAFVCLGHKTGWPHICTYNISSIIYLKWGLGVALVVHIFNWMGISYFDQTKYYYFMQISFISCLFNFCRNNSINHRN